MAVPIRAPCLGHDPYKTCLRIVQIEWLRNDFAALQRESSCLRLIGLHK
jgi:hypothetical protein